MQSYTEQYIYQALVSSDEMDKIRDLNPDDFALDTLYDWCDNTFGENMWTNWAHDMNDIEVFAFKLQEHRDWFILRWA